MAEIPARGEESTAAIGRHPIHPMLIPLPIAALIGVVVTDLAALNTGDPFWARASYWLLLAGLVTGLAAAVPGAIDFLTLKRPRSLTAGWVHALGNVTAMGLTLVNLLLRDGDAATVETTGLVLSVVVAALLGVTGWLGGELSYRYKVGVMEGPEGAGRL